MNRELYVAGLNSALHGAGLPYGYTITVWSSGQVLSDLHGTPAVWLVVCFAAGAVAGYGAMRWVTREEEPSGAQLAASPHLLRAGAVQVAAIGGAIGLAALLGLVPSAVAWPLGGCAATTVYLAGTSVEMALREGEQRAGADGGRRLAGPQERLGAGEGGAEER